MGRRVPSPPPEEESMAYQARTHVGADDFGPQPMTAAKAEPELVGTCLHCSTPFALGERSCEQCGAPLPLVQRQSTGEIRLRAGMRSTPWAMPLTDEEGGRDLVLGAGVWG